MSVKKKIAFHTLGCKLNFSETSAVSRLFDTEEYTRVDFNDRSDIYIINTCTVTGNADRKCRQAIKKAIASSSDAIVIVMGCYSQLYADEVKNITGISLVTGTGDKSGLPELIGELSPSQKARIIISPPENYNAFSPSWSQDDRTRSFLKIQDGCNYFCSYCTVPYARGRSRNGSVADITSLAKQIAGSGVREIVLSGVNIGDYGKTTGESLYDLLCSLESVDGIDRIRLSSVEPDLLNDEIIALIAGSGKFMPHFHIPLQSGCDKVLKLMNRRYQRKLFTDKISFILKKIPCAGIGTDVIAGFPGESEKDFMITRDFLENADISYIHVFSYSLRKNTKSAHFPDRVPHTEIARRSKILHELSERKHRCFCKKHIGEEAEVLFEKKGRNGKIYGFTGNYIRVETKYDPELANRITRVILGEISDNGTMKGRVLKKKYKYEPEVLM